MRRALARSLQQLLDDAASEGPPRFTGVRVRVPPGRIRQVADELQLLIDRLLTPGPVPARGVALVRELLADGSGPLYYGHEPDGLLVVLLDAVEQLAPLNGWH
jgi:hypothetical protein